MGSEVRHRSWAAGLGMRGWARGLGKRGKSTQTNAPGERAGPEAANLLPHIFNQTLFINHHPVSAHPLCPSCHADWLVVKIDLLVLQVQTSRMLYCHHPTLSLVAQVLVPGPTAFCFRPSSES